MTFAAAVETVGNAIDGSGIAILALGVVVATIWFLFTVATHAPIGVAYRSYRQGLGRAILLGLELLVAGDIIRTVVVAPTLGSVVVLAIIVLIRTFLSISLELELEGRWPWQRWKASEEGSTRPGPAV